METKWTGTNLSYTFAGDQYPEGQKICRFSKIIETPTEAQLTNFGMAIAKLGEGDTAVFAEISTKKTILF